MSVFFYYLEYVNEIYIILGQNSNINARYHGGDGQGIQQAAKLQCEYEI